MPDRLELLKGPPGVRRAHLDQVVAALLACARTPAPRLRAARWRSATRCSPASAPGAASRASISTWDLQLARHALALREDRARAVGALLARAVRRSAPLSSACAGEASLEYRPRTRARRRGRAARRAARAPGQRSRTRASPLTVRTATSWRSCATGVSCASYGSQGEQRLALLALLLAERAVLARERDRTPLMLLDDVMSELDVAAPRAARAPSSPSGGPERDRHHRPRARARRLRRPRSRACGYRPGRSSQEALAA